MGAKKSDTPCVVCNPGEAEPGEYCEGHEEDLHRLEHKYETLFRFRRVSRGKDCEVYELFLQGECDPCGRILVAEVDPESLAITVITGDNLDLSTRLQDYGSLGIERTYGDCLRDRIRHEVVHSWYGSMRACVDFFTAASPAPEHWDVPRRGEDNEEEDPDSPGPRRSEGGKHSVH
jgi:hypothetical protein